jgi:nitrate reductase NapE component
MKQALGNELIRTLRRRNAWSDLYRRNACTVHGLEYDDVEDVQIELLEDNKKDPPAPQVIDPIKVDPVRVQVEVQQPPPLKDPAETPNEPNKSPRRVLDFLSPYVFPLVAAGGVGAGALGTWMFRDGTDPPPAPPPVVNQDSSRGSLLQDLEDRGFHVRPAKG